MKTIKFRGYNLKNKKWLYGYYFVNRGKSYIVQDEVVNPFAEESDFEVDSESVGQFVGKYKGVSIFEGDYVHVTSTKDEYVQYFGFVEYDDQDCRFIVKFNVSCGLDRVPITGIEQGKFISFGENYNFYYQYKVIGNEYEQKIGNL